MAEILQHIVNVEKDKRNTSTKKNRLDMYNIYWSRKENKMQHVYQN